MATASVNKGFGVMEPHRVFVYGTLMSGYGNNRLLVTSKKLGEGRTLPTFTMLHLGGFPGVTSGGATAIKGEIWEVTDPTVLRNLDRLEGHPEWYRRTPITLEDGQEVELYLLPESYGGERSRNVVESGDWRNR